MEKSQTNFMVLVQNLQKNPAERKLFFRVPKSGTCCSRTCMKMKTFNHFITFNVFFFWESSCKREQPRTLFSKSQCELLLLSLQEVFPVQYGTKFDTALQALIAGLVCKLEQLFPVPNLSQVCVCVCFFLCFSSKLVHICSSPHDVTKKTNAVFLVLNACELPTAWDHDLNRRVRPGGMWRPDP